jgi:hypothetical protein
MKEKKNQKENIAKDRQNVKETMAYISHQIRNIAIFVLVDKSLRLMTSKKKTRMPKTPMHPYSLQPLTKTSLSQHWKSTRMLLCDVDEERQLDVSLHGTL